MTIHNLSQNSSNFPKRLTHLHEIPKSIHTIGKDLSDLLKRPSLAVVGSRKVSSYGRSTTDSLVQSAVKQGMTIISGLAFGVDSIAHEAALKAKGTTIAVLPSGIKKIYPASHQSLARRIVQNGGCLISEYPDDQLPMKHQFIERNRIIAALADALLITEAAENSGSLHTARFALEIGRPVMAVPGNINSPTSAGTNNLIKVGATPITSTEDIFEALDIQPLDSSEQSLSGDTSEETTILKLINDGIINGNEIFHQSNMSSEDYQRHLTMLEIKGRIKPLGNDKWALI